MSPRKDALGNLRMFRGTRVCTGNTGGNARGTHTRECSRKRLRERAGKSTGNYRGKAQGRTHGERYRRRTSKRFGDGERYSWERKRKMSFYPQNVHLSNTTYASSTPALKARYNIRLLLPCVHCYVTYEEIARTNTIGEIATSNARGNRLENSRYDALMTN